MTSGGPFITSALAMVMKDPPVPISEIYIIPTGTFSFEQAAGIFHYDNKPKS